MTTCKQCGKPYSAHSPYGADPHGTCADGGAYMPTEERKKALPASRKTPACPESEARERVSQVLETFYEVYGGAFDPCPDIGAWADQVLAAIRGAPAQEDASDGR